MSLIENIREMTQRIEESIAPRPDSPVGKSRIQEARRRYKEAVSNISTDEELVAHFENLAQSCYEPPRNHERFLYVTGRAPLAAAGLSRPQSPTRDFEIVSQKVVFEPLSEALMSENIEQLIEYRERIARSCGRKSREVRFIQRRILSLLLKDAHSDNVKLIQELNFYSKIEEVKLSGYGHGDDERRDCHLSILDNATRILEAGLNLELNELVWLETLMQFCYGLYNQTEIDGSFRAWFEKNPRQRLKNIYFLHQLDSKITLGFVVSSFETVPIQVNYAVRDMSSDDDLKKACLEHYRKLQSENSDERAQGLSALRKLKYHPRIKNCTMKIDNVDENIEVISRLWDRYFLGHMGFKTKFLERLREYLRFPDKGGDFIFEGGPRQIGKIAADLLAFALGRTVVKLKRRLKLVEDKTEAYLEALWEYGNKLFIVVNERETSLSDSVLKFFTDSQEGKKYLTRLGSKTLTSSKGAIAVILTESANRNLVRSEDIFTFQATSAEDYLGRPMTLWKTYSHMPDYKLQPDAWSKFVAHYKNEMDDKKKIESTLYNIVKDFPHKKNKEDNAVLITPDIIENYIKK